MQPAVVFAPEVPAAADDLLADDEDTGVPCILDEVARLKYPVLAAMKGAVLRQGPLKHQMITPTGTFWNLSPRIKMLENANDKSTTRMSYFMLKYSFDAVVSIAELHQLLTDQIRGKSKCYI